MKIRIDGKEILVADASKNIVEIADENGISITAPCFRNKESKGCCNACVIEVESKQEYACGTKPYEGMDIIYDREDLASVRKERLDAYAKADQAEEASGHKCGCKDPQNPFASHSSCGCSGSSCCG